MNGPGVYDELATRLMTEFKAEGVLVMIRKGTLGDGISCKASLEMMHMLPGLLRAMAEELEKDIEKAKDLCEICHQAPRDVNITVTDPANRVAKAQICRECRDILKTKIRMDATLTELPLEEWQAVVENWEDAPGAMRPGMPETAPASPSEPPG